MMETLEELVEHVRERVADVAEASLRSAAGTFRSGQKNLAEVEWAIQEDVRQVGRVIFGAALSTVGTGREGCSLPCECRSTKRYVSDRPKTLVTLFGPVEFRRAYYNCSNCGHGESPLDRKLGVEGTSVTPAVKDVLAWTNVEMPYGPSREHLLRVLGLSLAKDTHETVVAELGESVQPGEESRAREAFAGLPPAEQLYITCDGVKTNTTEGWKEPKLGAVFRAERNEDGKPVRGPTRYIGRIEDSETFGQRLWRLAEAAGVEKAKTVIVLGDGALWIWNLADFHFPGAVQIVDWYHATERLAALATRVWGESSPEGKAWYEARKAELWDGRVDAVLTALSHLTVRPLAVRDAIRKAIGYFEDNQHRMQYGEFRAKGHFIGSGVVEGACKFIIARRFKLSGMRWTIDGFHRLLNLRLCIINRDWDRFARSHFPRVSAPAYTYF